ncbi:MAG TPA: UDP-2,3-diacylglucosamine diphosphatase [Helicobacteraceae bacterium]|nr:UDP-2,3-diacylglucosamine diphosphatase [Helicobacteraceae bacterium]
MKYRSIFISDVHLGTRFSKAEALLDFFKETESENLFLVGDIIDGWAIKRKLIWPQSHSDVIQKVLRKARKGTKVSLITGNHDEFLRPFLPIFLGDNMSIQNELTYESLNKKRYLITHGDLFDSITMTKKWLAVLGDYGYDLLLHLNGVINWVRRIFGFAKYWSLSKYAKDNIKESVSFINDFETILSEHARHKAYDGVICGHIHKAEIRSIDGIEYLNCGDWVENCTAVVETMEGEWKILNMLSHHESA